MHRSTRSGAAAEIMRGLGQRVRGAVGAALVGIALTCGSAVATAAPVDCSVYAQAAQRGKEAEKTAISVQSAATKEALDAAKQCLANIDRAMALLIPGVSISLDFSGILSGMIARACQVVTSKINQAGQLVNGTVTDATNRVIGTVGGALPAGTVTGGTTAGGVTGVTGGTTGLGGTATIGAPAAPQPGAAPGAGAVNTLLCKLNGTC